MIFIKTMAVMFTDKGGKDKVVPQLNQLNTKP
jgi:hypothetical protein